MLLFTPLHWVWLKTLKPSARNSIARDSVNAKRLNNPMSKLVREGLFMELRPALPKVKPRGATKTVGLKRSGPGIPDALTMGGAVLGFPTTSGYDDVPTELPTPALSPKMLLVTVNGVPVWKLVIPVSCQPPSTLLIMPCLVKNGRS